MNEIGFMFYNEKIKYYVEENKKVLYKGDIEVSNKSGQSAGRTVRITASKYIKNH